MNQSLITASTVLQTIVYAVLLFRLWREGLAFRYRAFTAFLVFETTRILVAANIPRYSDYYAEFYLYTQPVLWLLYALVTLEVYQSVFRSLHGISRLSRYVIVGAVGVAIAVSASSFMLRVRADSAFPILELYFTVERAVFLSLLTFVLILVVFLSWFPVPVHKNAVTYSGVFALFFGVKTGAFLLRTVGGYDYSIAASLAAIGASVVSAALWIALLNAAGETRPVRSVVRSITPEREKQLVDQLQSFNDALLGSVPDRT